MSWMGILKSGPVTVEEWQRYFKEQETESSAPFTESEIGRLMQNQASWIWEFKKAMRNVEHSFTPEQYEEDIKRLNSLSSLWLIPAQAANKRFDEVKDRNDDLLTQQLYASKNYFENMVGLWKKYNKPAVEWDKQQEEEE